MLWINPRNVTLFGSDLTGVRTIAVSRSGKLVVEEWSDAGPFAVFADVAEISVEVVIEQVAREETAGVLGAVAPGDAGTLRFSAAPSAASAHAEAVEASVVVTGVKQRLHGSDGPTRLITLVAVSADGAADPIAAPSKGGK